MPTSNDRGTQSGATCTASIAAQPATQPPPARAGDLVSGPGPWFPPSWPRRWP